MLISIIAFLLGVVAVGYFVAKHIKNRQALSCFDFDEYGDFDEYDDYDYAEMQEDEDLQDGDDDDSFILKEDY